jgi:hypothetical protein
MRRSSVSLCILPVHNFGPIRLATSSAIARTNKVEKWQALENRVLPKATNDRGEMPA